MDRGNREKAQQSSIKGGTSLNYDRVTPLGKGNGLQRSTSVRYEKNASLSKDRLQRSGSASTGKNVLLNFKSRFQRSESVSLRNDTALPRKNIPMLSTRLGKEGISERPVARARSQNSGVVASRSDLTTSNSYATAPAGSRYFTPNSSLKSDILNRYASKPSSSYSSTSSALESSTSRSFQAKHVGRGDPPSQLIERMMASDLSSGISKVDDASLSRNTRQKSFSSLTSEQSKCRNLSKEDFSIGMALGKGRFGRVFLAKHIPSGFICALKMLNKENIKYTLENSFQNEVNIHGKISNPNIIQLYSCFADKKHVYLVLEYASQGDLYSKMKAIGRFAEDTAVKYIVQVINALKHLHDNHILHRDLKLENILVGSDGRLLLSDFGYAVQDKGPRKSMVGTPDYISPEIITGRSYGRSSDMWALGVLAYELLTGHTPFEVENDDENAQLTYARITKVDLKFPDFFSPLAVDFISKLLRKEPRERMTCLEALNHQWIASFFKEN